MQWKPRLAQSRRSRARGCNGCRSTNGSERRCSCPGPRAAASASAGILSWTARTTAELRRFPGCASAQLRRIPGCASAQLRSAGLRRLPGPAAELPAGASELSTDASAAGSNPAASDPCQLDDQARHIYHSSREPGTLSDHNHVGDAFAATLVKPVVIDGVVVAERGQTIGGRVAEAKKAGMVEGVSKLGVQLTDLSLVDGQNFPIQTQLISRDGPTSVGRDAGAIAGTTALGAAAGAAADWGRGAAIGAGAGAFVGIVGVLLTRGHPTIDLSRTGAHVQARKCGDRLNGACPASFPLC